MMNKTIHILMAVALILQPAMTEISVDIGYAESRLLPSIITSIVWAICLLTTTKLRRRNGTK